jgi:uncharacterized protein YndB with AHSA1/START domain
MAGKGNVSGTEAGKKAFIISRSFDAPRELMFRVWTDPEHMQRW